MGTTISLDYCFFGVAGDSMDDDARDMVLKRGEASRRSARTTMLETQVRVPHTNARVERAIARWRAQFRKVKLHLESRVGRRVEQDHPMVAWMVEWSAEVLLKFELRPSRRTRFEELAGHRSRHKVLAFGERVHLMPARDPGHRNKYDHE